VGIASDGRQLVESAVELQPDIVILDISMPQLNGLDAGAKIKAAKHDTKLIYVTAASSSDVAAGAFRRGASGYVLKRDDAEELRIAVRRALRGESFVSSLLDKEEIARRLRSGTRYRADEGVSRRQSEILSVRATGENRSKGFPKRE
jgi:DNA-binding NarL/FixJ family response regulator